MVVWRGSRLEGGAAARHVQRRAAAAAEQQEEHPGRGVLLLLVRSGASEALLFMRRRGQLAGHYGVAALSGAAEVDEDATRRQGRLKPLEAVGEHLAGGRPALGQRAQVVPDADATEAVQPLRGRHLLLGSRFHQGAHAAR